MGMVAPTPAQVHRLTLELKGGISQKRYQAYKDGVKALAEKYGARIKDRKKVKKVRKAKKG